MYVIKHRTEWWKDWYIRVFMSCQNNNNQYSIVFNTWREQLQASDTLIWSSVLMFSTNTKHITLQLNLYFSLLNIFVPESLHHFTLISLAPSWLVEKPFANFAPANQDAGGSVM